MGRLSVADVYREDLEAFRSPIAEFPVTSMSTDVGNQIIAVRHFREAPFARALDVGTGSGLHAAAMAVAGAANITAIDISGDALSAARQRFARVRSALDALRGAAVVEPDFRLCDMSQLQSGVPFDLICANPPSFFRNGEELGPPKTPMDMALFDGDVAAGNDATASFLYRFFDDVVLPHLAQGGVVVCGWPAIEQRVADDCDGSLVHPASRLNEWFGLDFVGERPAADAFFVRTAEVRNYGQDGGLLAQVRRDIDCAAVYSVSLVLEGISKLTFRYGILSVIRRGKRTFSLLGA